MIKPIFDFSDGELFFSLSKNIGVDTDGNMLLRLSDTMSLDMDTNDIHFTSSWGNDEDD